MSASIQCEVRLMKAEGFRPHVYVLNGVRHIGYGFNIDAGMSKYTATTLMIGQVREIEKQLQVFWWWAGLDDARCSVLLEMAFNMGPTGLLNFPKMLAAIGAKNWQAAHDECLDSDAARNPQLKSRYEGLAAILLNGK
jgi:lysozyme